MGISILSGTITTLGSGMSLFGGKMVIFQKFAIIITATISVSFVTAMFLFGALCHVVGPQDNFGEISLCFKKKDSETSNENEQGQT